ncbi:MAG: asparagine synthase (glutamine-hydrolyzing), partial [Alphaproteobacteria bacterium]
MCGFAAIFEPGRQFPPLLLAGMEQDLYHRGPDSGAVQAEPGHALVFRRLAIIDPSAAADQPMTDATGNLTLVFNGEIYNHRALRAELESHGHHFATTSDTEVILHGYAQWQDDLLPRLEGMFALAIIDRARQRALIARDPFGIKPLYMTRHGKTVAFASEMRPLYRLRAPRVDEAALAELLTFAWAAGRLSNIKDIERLPGGTALTVNLTNGDIAERRYCDPLDTLTRTQGQEPSSAEIEDALHHSVHDHLMSDVGFTLQLSGGLDSSLIAALTRQTTARPLTAYGVDLGDYRHNEAPQRAVVADHCHLDLREIALTGADFANALPRAVHHMEGPTPHGGCVMLMLLCDASRADSKVILTGEGADEFFGGYHRYAIARTTAWQERLGRLAPGRFWPPMPPFRGIRRMAGRDAAAYASLNRDPFAAWELFPGLVPAPGAREAASARFTDFRERLFAVDQSSYLESLLVRQDKMSMAASVEARVPFTHLPLARLVNRLPAAVRLAHGQT